MLVVRLLGQLEIALDGRPVELAARSAQALFAYLILHPGPQPRDLPDIRAGERVTCRFPADACHVFAG